MNLKHDSPDIRLLLTPDYDYVAFRNRKKKKTTLVALNELTNIAAMIFLRYDLVVR